MTSHSPPIFPREKIPLWTRRAYSTCSACAPYMMDGTKIFQSCGFVVRPADAKKTPWKQTGSTVAIHWNASQVPNVQLWSFCDQEFQQRWIIAHARSKEFQLKLSKITGNIKTCRSLKSFRIRRLRNCMHVIHAEFTQGIIRISFLFCAGSIYPAVCTCSQFVYPNNIFPAD